MESRRFQRRIENFVCEVCESAVEGDGFTNHCPHCLWSKHVDNFPGDRACECRGLMEPYALEIVEGQYVISHRCESCKSIRRVKASDQDSHDALIKLSQSVG